MTWQTQPIGMSRGIGLTEAHAAVHAIAPPAPSCGLIRLRRDGLPPLRFSARRIAQYNGQVPEARFWHDIAFYRTVDARYAIKITAQFLAVANNPQPRVDESKIRVARCHASIFETLDEALSLLESHDPANDICAATFAPALASNDAALCSAELFMQATMLHGFCEDVTRRYRIGVGALLAGIGLQEV